MSRPISNIATGFLSLLGLKNMGQNPVAMVDQVQPTIEMSEWYKFANAQTQIASAVLPFGPGPFPTEFSGVFYPQVASGLGIIVPQGQAWWVHEFQVEVRFPITATAIEAYNTAAMIAFPNANHYIRGDGVDDYQADASLVGIAELFTPPIRNVLVPSGCAFGMYSGWMSSTTGAAVWVTPTVRATLRWTPLII